MCRIVLILCLLLNILVFCVDGFIISEILRRLFNTAASKRITGGRKVKITGGYEAEPHSIPYQAAIYIQRNNDKETYFCGGSLITTRTVLTAAHCLINVKSIEVVLGAHNLQIEEHEQQRFRISAYEIHENYDPTDIIDDIAVIYLPHAAKSSNAVQTIDLPGIKEIGDKFEGAWAQQSGWGKTSDTHPGITDKLQKVYSRIISNPECNRRFFGIIGDGHICTNTDEGNSICHGDSGGPLVNDDQKLIGIASFVVGLGCEVNWPAGFTRVTHYLSWIHKKILY